MHLLVSEIFQVFDACRRLIDALGAFLGAMAQVQPQVFSRV